VRSQLVVAQLLSGREPVLSCQVARELSLVPNPDHAGKHWQKVVLFVSRATSASTIVAAAARKQNQDTDKVIEVRCARFD